MLRTTMKWIAPVAALGLLLGLGAASASAADEKGIITGTVIGVDGKPAEGAQVKVMEAKGKDDTEAGGKPVAVATAYTDKDGKFEIKDIAPGTYRVNAGVRKVSNGHEKVTVVAGQHAEVSITLKAAGEKPAASAGDEPKKEKKKGKKNKGEQAK